MIVVDLRVFVVKAGCVRSQEQEDSCARPFAPTMITMIMITPVVDWILSAVILFAFCLTLGTLHRNFV